MRAVAEAHRTPGRPRGPALARRADVTCAIEKAVEECTSTARTEASDGVLGEKMYSQIVVALYAPPFLPPMNEWYSGLIPYGPLVAAQLLIMGLYAKICADFTRGSGYFVHPRPIFGRGVLVFGYLYLASMVVRYVVRMTLYPEERWFGGCIPIVFHWVLASFIIAFGLYHRTHPLSKSCTPRGATLTT